MDEIRTIAQNSLCDAFGRTSIGGRKENQDAYGGTVHGSYVIMTVCDGMGGMAGGQIASNIARVEIMQTLMEMPQTDTTDVAEYIRLAIKNANMAIYRRALSDPPLRGMGTTATILVISPTAAFLTHVGDSRIYQFRKRKKVFRTFDHSKVFEMVALKMMTEEEARCSSFSNVITRALGIRPQVEHDVSTIPYRKGDRFVLCCDGIWNATPEPEMIELFNRHSGTEEEVLFLSEYIDKLGMDNGNNHDNLTVIMADMKQNSEYQHSLADYMHSFSKSLGSRIKGFGKLFTRKTKR